MPELTADKPKCMIEVGGRPVLGHVVDGLRAAGVRDISVVRGYCKGAVDVSGVNYFDNDEVGDTHEVYTLAKALSAIDGECLVSYGDVIMRKFVVQELLGTEDDFAVFVDSNWQQSRNRGRQADWVRCSKPMSLDAITSPVHLVDVVDTEIQDGIHGEWMGLLKMSAAGSRIVRELLPTLLLDPVACRTADMGALLRVLLAAGHRIRVHYTAGNWIDVDSMRDALDAGNFH